MKDDVRKPFKWHEVQRTCTKEYQKINSYKKYLKKDFHQRCAYCNLLDTMITTPFEIDHFVPRDAFKDIKEPKYETMYENLVYSCKKCNAAKGNAYKGDIKQGTVENEYFYDPVKVDYSTIFYRDEIGAICSDDPKGKDMIMRIKLYRPIHNMAWLCENVRNTLKKLDKRIEQIDENSEEGKLLLQAKHELSDYYIWCYEVFCENYNNNMFTLPV